MVNDLIIETNRLNLNLDPVCIDSSSSSAATVIEEHRNHESTLNHQEGIIIEPSSSSSSSSSAKLPPLSLLASTSIVGAESGQKLVHTNVGGNLSWKFFDQVSLLDYQLRDEESESQNNFDDNDGATNSREVLLSQSNLQQSSSNNNNDHFITGESAHLSSHHHYRKKSPTSFPIAMSSPGSPSTSAIVNINYSNNQNNHKINNNNVSNNHNHTISKKVKTKHNNNNKGGSAGNLRNDTMIGSTSSQNQQGVVGQKQSNVGSGRVPGGGSGPNIINRQKNKNHSSEKGIGFHLGLFGWRKKCLYILLLILMLLIIVNLVLTLWILKVMEFSSEGMGQLKIVPGGIQLSGQALIMDLLRASVIRSKHGQPITLESSRNFSINTRDSSGILENHLFLGHDKLECLANAFRINDTSGRNLFSVNRDEVTIGAHHLKIDGEGGVIFRESVQTPHVRAEPGRELRLESPTRQLEISAAKDINLQSRAGGLDMSALDDVKLSAIDGSIRFESSKIFLPNLKPAKLLTSGSTSFHENFDKVSQLCVCSNGKLFLASPKGHCADDEGTICR